MLMADIKGKLSLSEFVSEDYLTSSVFSVFRYLKPVYLEKFLKQAENIHGEKLSIKVEKPLYSFWPWFGNKLKYGGGAEPDVIIYSGDEAIVIEAKNYAGKSGEGIIFEGDNPQTIVDQLGREYFVCSKVLLNKMHVCDEEECMVKNFNLLFLTRHSFFPYEEIVQAIKAIGQIEIAEKDIASKKIYWINWHKAVPILEEIISQNPRDSIASKICNELLVFLDRRDINYFRGFDFLSRYQNWIRNIGESIFYFEKEQVYWDVLNESKLVLINTDSSFYGISESNYWNNLKWDYVFDNRHIFYQEVCK